MKLSSTSFGHTEAIPTRFAVKDAGGENVFPHLAIADVPEEAKSLALTFFDPDAPTGAGFWHLIAAHIPAETTEIAEGEGLPDGAVTWANDYGFEGYGGPCPPEGRTHRYIFTLHALDVDALDVPADASHTQARFTINAHTIAKAQWRGTFTSAA